MAHQVKLIAEEREDLGSGKVKRLRQEGLVPGIFYGKGEKNINLQMKAKDLQKVLSTEAGLNVIINLTIKSKKGEIVEPAFPQDVQINALTDKLEHIDLRKINLKEKITTKVRVRLTGEAPGIKQGGILIQQLHEIEIKCLPTDIPSSIDINISGLDNIGSALKAGEIKFPENVEPLGLQADQVAVAVLAPKKEEEVVAAPLEQGVEPEVIGKGLEAKEAAEAGAEGKVEAKAPEKGKEKEAKAEPKKAEEKKEKR